MRFPRPRRDRSLTDAYIRGVVALAAASAVSEVFAAGDSRPYNPDKPRSPSQEKCLNVPGTLFNGNLDVSNSCRW
jgi:hypothetical protein